MKIKELRLFPREIWGGGSEIKLIIKKKLINRTF